MLRIRSHLAVATCTMFLAIASSSSHAAIVLTFEGVGNGASINNFYNGGTDSAGHSGPNYGVSFSSESLGFISALNGGSGNFQGNPSGITTASFLTGAGDLMDVAAGFTTGFSFYYSSTQVGSVDVYSGLDGTGTLLASVPLGINFNAHCAVGSTTGYCSWDAIGVTFAGTAHSVNFGGVANAVGFDDITIGSATAGTVPEPASLALLGLGLAALSASRRRKLN